jgi:hypothetical protein
MQMTVIPDWYHACMNLRIRLFLYLSVLSAFWILLAACGSVVSGSRESQLPACNGNAPVFSQAPVDPGLLQGIAPLGKLNPPSHTFPTQHTYWYAKGAFINGEELLADVPDVVSPGEVWVTRAARVEFASRSYKTDYSIEYSPCDDLYGWFGHLSALDPALLAALEPFEDCSSRSTADESITECFSHQRVKLNPGDPIGKMGIFGNLDVGLLDHRVSHTFANPERVPWLTSIVCPLDYYAEEPRALLEALLGSHDGLMKRSGEPICGTVAQDTPGTAAGIWVLRDLPEGFVEGWGIALAADSIDPSKSALSMGNVDSQVDASVLHLTTDEAAPFNNVTDGDVRCFDAVPASMWVEPTPHRIVLSLIDDTLFLWVDRDAACGGWNGALPSSAIAFVR